MKEKTIAKAAAALAVALLTAVFATTTLAYAQSTTNEVIINEQSGEASGNAKVNQCANNQIDAGNGDTPVDVGACDQDQEP